MAAPLHRKPRAHGGSPCASRSAILAGESNALGADTRADEQPPELLAPRGDVPFWFEVGPREAIADGTLRITSWMFQPLESQSDRLADMAGRAADRVLQAVVVRR